MKLDRKGAGAPPRLSFALRVAVTGALLMVLGACGESSAPSVEATLRVQDDSVVTNWNGSASIDVLTNDQASSGAVELSAVGAPDHGSARIEAGRVVYTPAPGYFGVDTVIYTARAAQGGVTATARLSVTVRAQLTLTGTVGDLPLPNASLMVTVGASSFSTTTDAQGAYSLGVTSSDPNEVVMATGRGTAPKGSVKLVALLGEARTLAARAGGAGALTPLQVPGLRLTSISTALAAQLVEVNASTPPATQAAIDALSLRVSPSVTTDLGTAIRLVADYGVALPPGVADTAALVASPSTSAALGTFLAAQSNPADTASSERFLAARLAVLGDATVPMAPVAASGPQTVAYVTANFAVAAVGTVITYQPDGVANIFRPDGGRRAEWRVSGNSLQLTLGTPYSESQAWFDFDSQQYWTFSINTWGFAIRKVSEATVVLEPLKTQVWTSGPYLGQTKVAPSDGGSLVKAVDPATMPALSAADFPTGALWGGPLRGALEEPNADTMLITGPATAQLQGGGQSFGWSIVDGWLSTTTNGNEERRYRRLWTDALTGEEHWLVVDLSVGSMVGSTETMAVRAVPGQAFVADSSLQRRWRNGLAPSIVAEIYSDGTALETTPATWTLSPDGMFMLSRIDSAGIVRHRDWILMNANAGRIFVLEHLYFEDGSFDNWRINVHTNLGPSGR